MKPSDLKASRNRLGWTQAQAAKRLGVTQAYLSMLERGRRAVPRKLEQKLAAALKVSPLALPFRGEKTLVLSEDELAGELGALGYEGFRHLRAARARWNPADLLLAALAKPWLESRLVEALPWLAWRFAGLDWKRVVASAKLFDMQNRLGFVVTLARQLAIQQNDEHVAAALRAVEESLRGSVLLRAHAFGRLTEAERRWLEVERPPEAKQWNVLSDLIVQHLSHGT